MDTLVELLAAIRQRAGMYIGSRSAVGLHMFLEGWGFGKGDVPDWHLLREFNHWIAERYGIRTTHSWSDILEFYSEDGVEAFELFFTSFDEFMESRTEAEPED